ncbi:RteC domain-containing protein [Spirosoma sp.]|uniref:RteC domain-containing protein n=1 Tax=Spirosoma sp. TaxID=1899569 RepID=UPI00262DB67E|nr:RteC domain-containing protein [Spirosoma sp.]MCX6213247.1 RteC domain-containing protein [Spirosoma sp.]
MKDSTTQLQEKINAHLFRLFNKQKYGLPAYELIYEIVSDAKFGPTASKIKYATKLHWVIKDLFSTQYIDSFEIDLINEHTHTITYKGYRHYNGRTIAPIEQLEPIILARDKKIFEAYYAGKTVAELNETPLRTEHKKIDTYRKNIATVDLEKAIDIHLDEVFANMSFSGGYEHKLEKLLSTVIDTNYSKITFEDFIEQITDADSPMKESGIRLEWKGDKTDLAELVYALAKTGRISDTSTGLPVTQKELANQVMAMLGLDSLDVANLMKGRYGTKGKPTTYKAQEGRTFVNDLQTLLDKRVLD